MTAIVLGGAGHAATRALQSVLIPMALTLAMLGVTENSDADSTSAPPLVIMVTERPPTGVVGEMVTSMVAVLELLITTLVTVMPAPTIGSVVPFHCVRFPWITT